MPLIYLVHCDGDGCPREDRAQFDPNRGYFASGWFPFDGKTFCSLLCVAKYAATGAAEQAQAMKEALNGVPEEVPVA